MANNIPEMMIYKMSMQFFCIYVFLKVIILQY